jgi:tetratricopeptide (TPR) repeat protein
MAQELVLVMHKHLNALLLACAALSLAACSLEPYEPYPPSKRPSNPPSRQQQIPEPPSPQPRPNDLPDWTRNGQSSSRTPVAGLLNAARKEQQAGDFDHAEATLERALRIAPYDAEVLTELADVKLALGRGPQAEALANKSNGLVRDDRSLRARNDQIISAARRMRGE